MSAGSRVRWKRLVGLGVAVCAAVLLVVDTTFVGPGNAPAAGDEAFSAEEFAGERFPEIVETIRGNAVELSELVPEFREDEQAAGAAHGQELGPGRYAFPVVVSGTVTDVDDEFLVLDVDGLDGADVRVPLGTALSGTPMRDVTGIQYGDFRDQTEYQSVAHELKLRMESDVLADVDLASAAGRGLTVVGVWTSGGPPDTYLIQPADLELDS